MDKNRNIHRLIIVDKIWEENKKLILQEILSQGFQGHKIVSALPIPLKYTGYCAMIPENLNINEHLEAYPITNYYFAYTDSVHIKAINRNRTLGSYFDKERLIYLIGLISSIPAKNKDSIDESGFVRINTPLLRKFFKDYLSYLDYLVRTGIFICDGHYIPGRISRGFKFASQYEDSRLVKYTYSTVQQEKQIEVIPSEIYDEETQQNIPNPLLNFRYLSYWYEQKLLHIDEKKASEYAYIIMQEKFRSGITSWDINRDKGHGRYICRKHPRSQYNAIIYNISSISIGDYNAKIDSNVHRLHSAITNMQKDYRKFLTYDGQSLINIDIANSQPYLLCLLLNPSFWDKNSSLSLNIGMLPPNIQERFSEEQISNIISYLHSLNFEQIQGYITKASRGEVYDYMVDVINSSKTNTLVDRDTIKTMILVVFFSSNRFYQQTDAKLKRVFNHHFPAIYEFIKLTKSNHKEDLACLLQSIESEIILHRCCKRIWEEGHNQVPAFTIHDSITTTIEYWEYVKQLMEEELFRAIGVSPTLNIENWNLDKVEYPQILHDIIEQ